MSKATTAKEAVGTASLKRQIKKTARDETDFSQKGHKIKATAMVLVHFCEDSPLT